MNRDEILDNLQKLVQLDVDATHAYDQAIKNVKEQVIKDKLIQFQADHRRHIDLLSAKVLELGGTPPELTSDFKGFIISGFTALRSLTGTTSKYEEAAKKDFPVDVSTIIQSNLSDEQRHLSFIREAITTVNR